MNFILDNYVFESMLIVFIGLVMGSFSSMLCYRLPRDIPVIGKSEKSKFSFCPNCKNRLKIFDLIPLLSWIFQRGKCRYCQLKISIQYPVVEVLTLALTFLGYMVFGLSVKGIVVIVMAPILTSLFVIDWNFRILPNVLNLALFLGGLIFQILNNDGQIWFYLLAALVYPASMLFIRWVFLKITGKDGLGLGDIKFFAAAGVWLGLPLFSLFLLASSVFGIVFGLIHKLMTKEDMFPFGPALIVSFLVCFYCQDWILQFV